MKKTPIKTLLNISKTTTVKSTTPIKIIKNEENYDLNLKQILTNYLNQVTNSKYEYDYFLAQLKQKQNNGEFMLKVINDLKQCVHFLDPTLFENLVYSLFFDFKFYSHVNNVNLLNSYKDFITDLISAYTQYIYKCLTFLIKLFLTTKNTDPAIKDEDLSRLYEFSHCLILNLIKIAPSCKTHVVKLADTLAPYMIKDTCIQEAYVRNLLKLANNLPELRLQMLEICVQKMLKIDVNAPRDQIVSCEIEDDIEEDIEIQKEEEKPIMKHPFADRLDFMMLRLFEFINDRCKKNEELDWNECKSVYKDLLFTFDKYILSTYGSSHVQFLLFYTCSFRTNLSEGFLDYLWKKFSNPNTCPITRQLCTYYIGSFLSRANYIPLNTITASMHLMCTWLLNYIDKVDASKSYPSIDLHRTFYALSQTVFYIFIFRHRELIATSSNKSIDMVKSWKFSSIISSKMNPLRYCLPTITKKFASLARLYQLAYCYSIIDNNNRLTLPSLSDATSLMSQNNHNSGLRKFFNSTSIDSSFSNTTSTVDNSQSKNLIHQDNPLDSFFPFDPYLLTRSKIFIQNFYQDYNSIDDEQEEEDDEEEDEMMSEDDGSEQRDDDDEDEEMIHTKSHNPWSEEDDEF
jgi:RNA polymerase I-specific transcription initiation factor RRN3